MSHPFPTTAAASGMQATAVSERTPRAQAPAGAQPVLISLRLTAKDGRAFLDHLLSVIPVTRTAAGCRYSHTYRSTASEQEFVLLQGWDSAEQQQAYLAWRERRGDLAKFLGFLSEPPVIGSYRLIDA